MPPVILDWYLNETGISGYDGFQKFLNRGISGLKLYVEKVQKSTDLWTTLSAVPVYNKNDQMQVLFIWQSNTGIFFQKKGKYFFVSNFCHFWRKIDSDIPVLRFFYPRFSDSFFAWESCHVYPLFFTPCAKTVVWCPCEKEALKNNQWSKTFSFCRDFLIFVLDVEWPPRHVYGGSRALFPDQ